MRKIKIRIIINDHKKKCKVVKCPFFAEQKNNEKIVVDVNICHGICENFIEEIEDEFIMCNYTESRHIV